MKDWFYLYSGNNLVSQWCLSIFWFNIFIKCFPLIVNIKIKIKTQDKQKSPASIRDGKGSGLYIRAALLSINVIY